MALLDNLIAAVLRSNGDGLVMHVGEQPYILTPSGPLTISRIPLKLDAILGLVRGILPAEALATFTRAGSAEAEVRAAGAPADSFTIVAACGKDDVWIELRRRRSAIEAPNPDPHVTREAPPAATPSPTSAMPGPRTARFATPSVTQAPRAELPAPSAVRADAPSTPAPPRRAADRTICHAVCDARATRRAALVIAGGSFNSREHRAACRAGHLGAGAAYDTDLVALGGARHASRVSPGSTCGGRAAGAPGRFCDACAADAPGRFCDACAANRAACARQRDACAAHDEIWLACSAARGACRAIRCAPCGPADARAAGGAAIGASAGSRNPCAFGIAPCGDLAVRLDTCVRRRRSWATRFIVRTGAGTTRAAHDRSGDFCAPSRTTRDTSIESRAPRVTPDAAGAPCAARGAATGFNTDTRIWQAGATSRQANPASGVRAAIWTTWNWGCRWTGGSPLPMRLLQPGLSR